MIEGIVNANYEAVITLPLQGSANQVREVEAVIDTGYNGLLTLPPSMVAELSLPIVSQGRATLADGSEAAFNVYGVTVVWDDKPMYVETGAVGVDPLVGMALLDGHNLNIDVENGGRVLIQPKA